MARTWDINTLWLSCVPETKQNQDEILRRSKIRRAKFYSKGNVWSISDMKEEVQYGLEARRSWQHFGCWGRGKG